MFRSRRQWHGGLMRMARPGHTTWNRFCPGGEVPGRKSPLFVRSKELCGKVRKVRRDPLRKQAKITSKGQITIPREVRRALGVRPGDRLLFEGDEKGIRVRPARTESP